VANFPALASGDRLAPVVVPVSEYGEAWDVSPLVLHKALAKKGFVIPAPQGRIGPQPGRAGPAA
jgi:hypothetical protein